MSDILQRIRRYLRNGKSQLIQRPDPKTKDHVQRVVTYRTEVCVAHHYATKDGADQEVLDYLRTEHDWALATMEAGGIRWAPVCRGEQMPLDWE